MSKTSSNSNSSKSGNDSSKSSSSNSNSSRSGSGYTSALRDAWDHGDIRQINDLIDRETEEAQSSSKK